MSPFTAHAELRALSLRISIHALEYLLTISPPCGSPPWSIFIVLVGNQIADSAHRFLLLAA